MEDLSQCFIHLIEENDLSQVSELMRIDKATCKNLEKFGNISFSTSLTSFILKFFFFTILRLNAILISASKLLFEI
jgi:hypothetical protein